MPPACLDSAPTVFASGYRPGSWLPPASACSVRCQLVSTARREQRAVSELSMIEISRSANAAGSQNQDRAVRPPRARHRAPAIWVTCRNGAGAVGSALRCATHFGDWINRREDTGPHSGDEAHSGGLRPFPDGGGGGDRFPFQRGHHLADLGLFDDATEIGHPDCRQNLARLDNDRDGERIRERVGL